MSLGRSSRRLKWRRMSEKESSEECLEVAVKGDKNVELSLGESSRVVQGEGRGYVLGKERQLLFFYFFWQAGLDSLCHPN